MIAWILLILSAVALALIFLRRFRLTTQDLKFQKHLQAEEAEREAEEAVEEAAPVEKPGVLKNAEQASLPLDEPEEAPKVNVRKLFLKADVHFARKEWEDAEPILLTIVEADPQHLDAHHKLGLMHLSLGDFPKAELYFSKLVSLKKDPVYFSNLGAALYQQQRLVEAAEAYENAIAMDDKRAARLESLAQVYHELGDRENALQYFERASKRKPKDVNLLMVLADYYNAAERAEEAREVLKKVLDLDPYNEEAQEMMGGL